MAWTDERKEKVKRLWADGMSASEIAAELGDITRNAVIGVVHRMGLPKRRDMAPTVQKRRVPTQRRAPKRSTRPLFSFVSQKAFEPLDELAVIAAIVPPVEPPLSLLGLTEATCRWPIGDPQAPDFRFCGHAPHNDKPYCLAHCAMAYQPTNQSRRKASDRNSIFCAERAA